MKLFAVLRWLLLVAMLTGVAGTFSGCKTRPQTVSKPPPAVSTNALATFDHVWQVMSETHYDTNYGGVDWKGIRDEFRPKVEKAKSDREMRMLLQTMLGRLGISHTAVMPGAQAGATNPIDGTLKQNQTQATQADQSGEPGIEFRNIEGRYVVTHVEPEGPADKAGVRRGWVLQSIEGNAASDKLAATALGARHDEMLQWGQIVRQLKGPPGKSVDVDFLDERDRSVSLKLQRRQNHGMPVKLGYLPMFYAKERHEIIVTADNARIGYLQFNVWMPPLAAALDQAVDELRQCDGIVLDLRGNIGGVAAMTIGFSGHFLDKPLLLGVMKTRDTELTLTANPRTVNAKGKEVTPLNQPLAILVDECSASTSEMFAGAMQSLGRARIFGATTLGEVLPAVCEKLPNGDLFLHAFGDFRTAKGERLEGRGVEPDSLITLSRKDLLEGHDKALEAATEWIRTLSLNTPNSAIRVNK